MTWTNERETRSSMLIHHLTTPHNSRLKSLPPYSNSKPPNPKPNEAIALPPNSPCEVPRPPHNHRTTTVAAAMSDSDFEDPPRDPPPAFLLHRPPLMHPSSASPLLKQRSWSPDVCRNEAWLRRKGNWKNRRTKSVTDEDVDELKACIELGFGFESSPEVELDRRLSDTLPALELYHAVNKSYSESRFHKPPTATAPSSSAASDRESTPSPISSPRTAIFGTDDDPQTVKTRLRQWAQVVACAVRQSSC
ncbi:uncharacterized protein LOC130740825 [Lotus japonicus]|uniref:uncharacterized protein LOC130740825 n=1 Tax=Lotus japonicus TaxID=34305 RepID=UPI0025850B2D|nr:uncharacterized protein LOC130740825 [Lotus japonicus]